MNQELGMVAKIITDYSGKDGVRIREKQLPMYDEIWNMEGRMAIPGSFKWC